MRKIEPNAGSNARGMNAQNVFGRAKTNQRSRSLAGQFGPQFSSSGAFVNLNKMNPMHGAMQV